MAEEANAVPVTFKSAGAEIRLAQWLPVVARVAVGVVIAGSAIIFCGWAFGSPTLTRLLPSGVAMNPVTALAFILAGLGVCCLPRNTTGRCAQSRWPATILGLIVAMIGLLKLFDYLPARDLNIDRLIFYGRVAHLGPYPMNELAPNTALAFVLCGLALALAERHDRAGPPPSHLLMLGTGFIALLALVGYSYRVLMLYRLGSQVPMSLESAVGFELVSLGFFAQQADRGFMRLVLSRTTGGAISRRLLPTAILVPWGLGALILLSEKTGHIARASGLSLFAVACILIFTVLIWWNARLLHLADLARSNAAERLRRMTDNLERSNRELQEFAYVASHDLFEPLRMITSYLQLVNERHGQQLDAEGREFVGYAVDGAKRMHALIQDLLAYTRVELRGHPLAPTDTEPLLQQVLTNLKVAIEESGATVAHGKLPQVQADAVQLAQVFQNLLGNAIKFHGPEPPRVEINARRDDSAWVFSVRDNGIGIDPKEFDRIFVIFQRLHTRQDYPGTGIGLAICKKIIERHGGRIWVESAPGRGATFFFTLPDAPPDLV